MNSRLHFLVYVFYVPFFGVFGNFNSFMDNVYFAINWAGPDDTLKAAGDDRLSEADSVLITTSNNEKYRCILPVVIESGVKENINLASVPIELDLLKPLFEQTSCTYRLETFWTYELCHGRHLRQYHEEKEMGKKAKLQEYFLGRYKMETFAADYEVARKLQSKSDEAQKPNQRSKKVQGIEIPYYEVVYTDGTVCDLTGQPRKSHLHYVCQPDGRGEIYELKEISSCEYEVVVLSNQLCSHPAYGPKKEPTNTIHCHSLDGAPKRPLNSDALELENPFEQFNSKQEDGAAHNLWDLVGQIIKEHGLHEEYALRTDADKQHPPVGQRPQSDPSDRSSSHQPPQTADTHILKEFIEGSFCIEGGAGWWKHKFCFGRQVVQYHVDNLRRDIVVLGEWNEESHLNWISENPHKRPRPTSERKYISLYYGGGDLCDLTGKNRFAEVKIQCVSSPVHPNSVAIYLTEHKVCEYKLVVESPLFCQLILQADPNGLIVDPKL